MFQPFIPSESADLLQEQFSVWATVAREFVEELYGVQELETDDGRVDPQAIYRRREARLLADMMEHGGAALLYTGVGVNLPCVTRSVRSSSSRILAGMSASVASFGSATNTCSSASRPTCCQINGGCSSSAWTATAWRSSLAGGTH